MVGKPNLPKDSEQRPEVKGSSTPTPGLTSLDQEREASMADEGGASGAAKESEDPPPRRKRRPSGDRKR